jgi:hypothetical protein
MTEAPTKELSIDWRLAASRRGFVAAPHERWAKLANACTTPSMPGDDTTSVVDPELGGCQNEGTAVDRGVLVVSGREPTPVFEAVECSLDDVAAAVVVAVVGDWPSAA